jgi:1-acyl-sn-glycerol-3-phosphate acyltransferase
VDKIIKVIARAVMKVLFRVEIINKDNVPRDGKAILCSNHIHLIDGPLILAFTERKVNFIAKENCGKINC